MTKSDSNGSVIILTGASEGIGRALAHQYAKHGTSPKPKLVLVARNQQRLEELSNELKDQGLESIVISGDVSNRLDCETIVNKTIEHFDRIDVLINNAGITLWANFESTTGLDTSEKVMAVNFNSVLYMTHYALPHILKTKGHLVAVSSVSGFLGVPGHAVYGASKHAIHGFYDSLRLELKEKGVDVSIVAPDFIQTEIHFRGLDGSGKPMGKRLGNDIAMDADKCANIMYRGISKRQRLIITSTRGKFAYPLRGVVPEVIDALALKSRDKHKLV